MNDDQHLSTPTSKLGPPHESPFDNAQFSITVAVTSMQKRGLMSIPASLRDAMNLNATNRVLLVRHQPHAFLVVDAPDPLTLFTRHDGTLSALADLQPSEAVPGRWLDVPTILRAQQYPDSVQRRWFVECNDGFVSVRVDPVIIADLLGGLASLLSLPRPQLAHYVQVILTWTGLTVPDRDLYLSALEVWGTDPGLSWAEAVQRCREAS